MPSILSVFPNEFNKFNNTGAGMQALFIIIEPPHGKTNKMASAQSDQSLRCPHEESLDP